ncbi:hypothetical protein [uncultured Tateyamaria sp.]|uniref:hypothetical protein n=1 Tax=uncultured Tateyamaria sp. TaxID=455651 RepID=UPI0026185A9F|nr:hypothetical protein [uncultured Tateyamaria sp.]
MSETTNRTTADHATQRSALPLRSLQVIGIMGTDDNRRALLRTPAGQIRQIVPGDRLRQGTVAAISVDAVILQTATGQRVLRLPEVPGARAAA